MNCLELARKNRARILLASTSEVYGDPDVHPQVESYRGNVNCDGPRACYDEGKRAGEAVAFDYYRMYGVEIRVVFFIFFIGKNFQYIWSKDASI